MSKNQKLAVVLAVIVASVILLGMASEWNDHPSTRVTRAWEVAGEE